MKLQILLSLCLLSGVASAAEPPVETAAAPAAHAMARAASLQWGDAPAALPRGAQAAVLSGDPGKPVAFAIRLKLPAGYRIPRHRHPADEQVTVIDGDLTLSMGAADAAHAETFARGDYINLPAGLPHEATTRNGAVLQIQSTGPFGIDYDNAAEDPRGRTGDGSREPDRQGR